MNDALPHDPFMLLSYINTKLRDDYPTLTALCDDMDINLAQLKATMASAGFEYNPKQNRFW